MKQQKTHGNPKDLLAGSKELNFRKGVRLMEGDMGEIDNRVIELEVKVSFLERQLDEINTIVVKLREDVERLSREVHELEMPRTPHPPLSESPLDL